MFMLTGTELHFVLSFDGDTYHNQQRWAGKHDQPMGTCLAFKEKVEEANFLNSENSAMQENVTGSCQ